MNLYIFNIDENRKFPIGLVGFKTDIIDDNNKELYVGDIVKVTYKKAKWSKLRMVCFKDYAFIQGVPHIRTEDREDFIVEKVISHTTLTDGFHLYDNYIIGE